MMHYSSKTSDTTCACESAILQNRAFNHYQKKKDRLGSEFDDFGWYVYRKTIGEEDTPKEIRCFAHKSLGLYYSGSHAIEQINTEGFEFVDFVKDNSIIPQIREYLKNNRD